jgi:hypothetical protein
MRRLYNDNEKLTEEGNGIGSEVESLLTPLFDRARKDNISFRDLGHLIMRTAQLIESQHVLLWQMEQRKKRYNVNSYIGEEGPTAIIVRATSELDAQNRAKILFPHREIGSAKQEDE